jgi:CheY-like chemotaxis protein
MTREEMGRVLLVEDEYLVAVEAAELLAEMGYAVVATTPTLEAALDFAQTGFADCALLDINLGGTLSFPVADVLSARGIPFAFVTAYPPTSIPSRFKHIATVQKPFDGKLLCGVVASLLSSQ